MEKKKKITAICGWALSEEWFRQLIKSYFPQAEVHAYYPKNPESEKEAEEVFDLHSDWFIGYSLGSLWLLAHKNKIPQHAKIILMAPILAFPAEKNMGGKTPLAKLKYQKKALNSSDDYLTSLKAFFDLSGIRQPESILYPSYSREVLIRGLDFLESVCVSPDAAEGCAAIIGLRDSLLDGHQLKELIPQLTLVEECDHSPNKLLSHLAQQKVWSDMSSSQSSQPTFPQ